MAHAPFCNVTGASEDAPPPILPVADIRFEVDRDVFLWTWCHGIRGEAVTEARSLSHQNRVMPTDTAAWPDAGAFQPVLWISGRREASRVAFELSRTAGPLGFAPQVYRPPR